MCRINSRIDFAFKKSFWTESNKKLLIDLTNLVVSKKEQVKKVEVVERIKKAVELLDDTLLTYEERESYEARLKWIRDEEAAKKAAEKRGFVKGVEEGLKSVIEKGIEAGIEAGKLEIARSLLDVLDIKTISEKIGISEEKILKLKNEK
ncbi:PD-(D/E)XK nuclease family transposase [Haliovirga abyssi]|uniref:Rpn family recombination-promoting nuclease/putative transposase n=1 Tax=Haliovirga abyssi TaxID=2996794 RepID=A0AAU9D587_9FUSO|nr:PD-(D/E)XK nuclease family transposase [Haliovirga abyssi]BDU51139.1 hypothetical protein HLVA_17080 [Haliovirga abyssi]